MKINRIAALLSACALGLLALIWFQVKWMNHSRMLLEEQFNNRVNMALCSTVEKMAENQTCTDELRACCAMSDNSACKKTFNQLVQTPEMQTALGSALHFYQIDLPFKVHLTPKDSLPDASFVPFSCSLDPILQDDTHLLQLEFPDKTDYFLHRMGAMIASSVAILLFICLVFGLAVFYLLRQKRMSDRNREFFNHMTHEFRTPLTNIRLASNLLVKKNKDLADNQYLGIIRRECGQLTHQVENVLYLAGLEKGESQLQKTSVDLRQLARDVVAGMDLQIQERAAQVRLDGGAAPCTVSGDAFHLGNAFRNILDNALKYSGKNPDVAIEFDQQENGCRVRFTDNGVGLSAAERRKVFHKFQRCDTALFSGEKGFGLGLAYVKKIVELHRGRISLRSEKGQGCCFDLYLPATRS